MDFCHYFITRFNVNINPGLEYAVRLKDSWLSTRFELFHKYCFPTIEQQRNQNFKWIVLFDEKTPEKFKPFIKIYQKYPNFLPVYCADFESIIPAVVDTINATSSGEEWIVTTRLDSDDALSVDFVDVLHNIAGSLGAEHFQKQNELFINFMNGLQFHEGDFYDFKDATNAFVSLVERREAPHTVFWVDHPLIHDVAPVLQAETTPVWLQVVHDLNVYNYVRGQKLDPAALLTKFPCAF